MDVYDTMGSILDSNAGKIRGRTAIQKLVYLAKEKIPGLDIPEYKPHYYGPYSPGVSLTLEKMTSYSFIQETTVPSTKFEGYSYELTDDGKEIITQVKNEQKEQYNKISEVVKTCKDVCGLDISSLSVASKILFMQKHDVQEKMSNDELKIRAQKLGWDITDEQIDKGIMLLQELKLG